MDTPVLGGVASWSFSLASSDSFLSESTSTTTGSLASDDSFLESKSTTVVSPGNVDTIGARHPELTDTATTFYLPLPHDLDEMSAFVNDSLDGDTRDDETCKGSDEDWMDNGVLSDESDSDTGELISQGFRDMVSELLVVLLNRKRKRDELDGHVDYEPLTPHTWERKKTCGRAGSSVDSPTAFDDDGAVAEPGPIVLSDSESEEDDCGIDVARDGDAADESIAPTPESADDED